MYTSTFVYKEHNPTTLHSGRSLFLMPLLLASIAATIQGQEAASQRYAQVNYLKVSPAKATEFIEFYKTGLGSKAIRAMNKANPARLGWSMRQVIYPGENAPAANFSLVTIYNGVPAAPDPAKRDEIYRAATGFSYAEYLGQVSPMAESVGSGIYHVHEPTPGLELQAGDILTARRLKTAPGKGTELSTLIRTMRMPIVTERTKLGHLKGYVFSHAAIGSGGSSWDATETWVYKDLAGAIGSTTPARSVSMQELFAKVHPGKNAAEFRKTLDELATTIRTDVYRIAVAIAGEGVTTRSAR